MTSTTTRRLANLEQKAELRIRMHRSDLFKKITKKEIEAARAIVSAFRKHFSALCPIQIHEENENTPMPEIGRMVYRDLARVVTVLILAMHLAANGSQHQVDFVQRARKIPEVLPALQLAEYFVSVHERTPSLG